jgi:hypothetical protein
MTALQQYDTLRELLTQSIGTLHADIEGDTGTDPLRERLRQNIGTELRLLHRMLDDYADYLGLLG